jgi:hypothetical protein
LEIGLVNGALDVFEAGSEAKVLRPSKEIEEEVGSTTS